MRTLFRILLGLFMIAAGVNHFRDPQLYLGIIPPQLPFPAALNVISGAAEIAGGLGLFVPGLRTTAAWGLVALFIAVFPANIHGAIHGMTIQGREVPAWILWARLPFQAVFIAWAWWSCSLPAGRKSQ